MKWNVVLVLLGGISWSAQLCTSGEIEDIGQSPIDSDFLLTNINGGMFLFSAFFTLARVDTFVTSDPHLLFALKTEQRTI
jgi:hypothetical protein